MQEKDIEAADGALGRLQQMTYSHPSHCGCAPCFATRTIKHLISEVSAQSKTISALQIENVGILQRNRELELEIEKLKGRIKEWVKIATAPPCTITEL